MCVCVSRRVLPSSCQRPASVLRPWPRAASVEITLHFTSVQGKTRAIRASKQLQDMAQDMGIAGQRGLQGIAGRGWGAGGRSQSTLSRKAQFMARILGISCKMLKVLSNKFKFLQDSNFEFSKDSTSNWQDQNYFLTK